MASSQLTTSGTGTALGEDISSAGGDATKNQEQLDRIVLGYLKRKGYRLTEDAFKREARLQTLNELSCELQPGADASIPNYVLYYSQAEQGDPGVYQRSFEALRRWLDTSLDMYRVSEASLHRILRDSCVMMTSRNCELLYFQCLHMSIWKCCQKD
jgi:hypothetical protein